MNKKKEIFPQLRFGGYKSKWIIDSFDFEFLQTNSFSRAEMDDEKGNVKNIHYGDILTKYNDILRDISVVPFVNKNIDLSKFREESYLKNGDIVIADTAEDFTAGKAVEVLNVDFPVLAGQHTFLCRPKIKFAPGFMGYYLNSPSYHNRLIPLLTGTKVYSISKANIKSTFVLYPENYEEQQKIADCLSSIDELIDAESRKLKALEKYKKGLMQKLFPAEGKTVPEWRFPEFQDCEEWETVKLEKLALYRRGSIPQPYGLPEWYDEKSGMPFIQVFDVDDNMKLKSNTKNKISELAAQQSVFIPKGTLIITIQGSIGRVAITQYDAYIDRTLLLFEKFFRKIDKTFLAYNLQLLFDIEKQKAPGGIIKTITKQALSEFLTSIPRIEEQEKIAGCLSEVDTMITEQSNKVEQLKAHKKGLMQGLFPSLEEADV